MDNLTHSLAGALLGQMGLKRLSGRSMPTLIIAANIPDIDAVTTLLGAQSLAIRRGITHGPLAMLLLPLLLTGIMLAWNRWRPAAQPVRASPLLLLAYAGTLSHPALDWLNSYGIRLLEPFSSRWLYGDTLFIIDVWIWAALILGFWISRRREKASRSDWRRPAIGAFAAICGYIVVNGLITSRAEALTREAVTHMVRLDRSQPIDRWLYRPGVVSPSPFSTVEPDMVVANPQPLRFWRRTMLWRGDGLFGSADFDWLRESDSVILEGPGTPINLDHPSLAASRNRPDVRAFLFWSRMPFVFEADGRAVLADQRFYSRWTRGQFLVPLDLPAGRP